MADSVFDEKAQLANLIATYLQDYIKWASITPTMKTFYYEDKEIDKTVLLDKTIEADVVSAVPVIVSNLFKQIDASLDKLKALEGK